jgi:hypothetical protein
MNNQSNGINVLKNMGVDKNFVDSMYKKYGRYAGKIGINEDYLRQTITNIENSLQDNRYRYQNNAQINDSNNNQTNNKKSGFDNSKYPKV